MTIDGGTVDFGTTRQTIGGWTLKLSNGAVIEGTGGTYSGKQAAMDYHLGGTVFATSGNSEIKAPIRIRDGKNVSFDVAENAGLKISGLIRADGTSTAGSITKEGKGTLELTTANSYTGTTSVNGGILRTSADGAFGSSAVSINNGGTLELSAANNSDAAILGGAVTINNGGKLLVKGSNNKILDTDITVNAGGRLSFDGNEADMLDYNVSKTLTADGGIVDFGSTRQTIRGWTLILKNGATLQGAGQKYSTYTAALDFDRDSTIKAESGTNHIQSNIRLRNNSDGTARHLTFNVGDNATLEISGRMHADTEAAKGKVTKDGTGDLILTSRTMLGDISTKNGEIVIAYTGDDGNTVGNIDSAMTNGTTANGTLRVAEDAKLTVTGNIWSRPNTGIRLDSGAELNMSGKQIVFSNRGTNTASLNSTSDGMTYGINSEDYVLTNAHASYTGTDANATLSNKLVNSSVENAGSGKLKVNNAGNSLTDVYATGGDLEVLQAATGLNLSELTLAQDKTVGLYTGADATTAEANVTVSKLVEFGKGARLNANLTLASGSTLSVAEGGLSMGSTLTLQQGITLDDSTLNRAHALQTGESLALFTGVDGLTLGNDSYSAITEEDNILAAPYFSNLDSNNFVLTYTGTDNGTLNITMLSMTVPEPTTATLSLLALTALAARRRRRL